MQVASSACRPFVPQTPFQAIGLDGSLAVLMKLLFSSDMTLEEGFCAFAFVEGDGDFDPKHRMGFTRFRSVAVEHLSSRLSESAIAELFHTGLDLNGDGYVDGDEWLRALRSSQQLPSRDAAHESSLSSSARLKQQPLGVFSTWKLDATLALQSDSLVHASIHNVSQTGADAQDTSAQVERNRHTPMLPDERQHTRESIHSYLDVSLCALEHCRAA